MFKGCAATFIDVRRCEKLFKRHSEKSAQKAHNFKICALFVRQNGIFHLLICFGYAILKM